MVTQKYSISPTFSYGLIYIYSISDGAHAGRLKIGSATVADTSQASLEAAAHERIKQQTKTADIRYELEYITLAQTVNNDYLPDYAVHEVLKRSGYERQSTNVKNTHSEWFKVDLTTAINAVQAAKEGRAALDSSEKLSGVVQHFDFRPNQLDAVEKTTRAIKRGRKHFLWNAKMRFGKTSTAMEVARVNGLQKVLIITHRPSVSQDWYEDFNKVFQGTSYQYSSKDRGENITYRLSHQDPFVYFASLQDLRLSEAVVTDESSKSNAKGFKKNDEIFATTWDMLIVDEAHEGTQSNLGNVTIEKIDTKFTLELSGTPFNIIHKREEDEVYTWDYVMEQHDKVHWDETHPGMPNPYAELPALSMFTYDIDKFSSHIGDLGTFADAVDGAFKFHEFLRVIKDEDGNDTTEFVYKEMVNKFLDLLVDDKLATRFPYATQAYRDYNKHSLWHLPNRTKVIEAMEKLLKAHPVFSKFGIVNISGNATADDEADTGAKDRVMNAIKNNEYTITLTGQRLTTGASIPQWTAVCMMSDTNSATTYLQTAFRCQTPARIDGKLKTQGYVFDFAPDRTLRLVAEAIELNHKSGKVNTPEQRQAMSEFLNFCPILSAQSGSMREYDVSGMLEQLKKAIVERVSRNGFDDPKLYNDELLQLDELEITKFNNLKELVGASNTERTNEIKVNDLGMNKLVTEQAEEAERKQKKKKQLTPEEEELLKKLKQAREQKKSAISILRAVSIRMPMLVYGAHVAPNQGISLQDFIKLVDDESWVEFMPKGLTKDTFREFTKYYDEEVFHGVTKNIRLRVYECDKLLPVERIQAIAEIFATFKNPDKETVLTPWDVVNMHMVTTLGGHDFRDGVITKTGQPEWKSAGEPTSIWSHSDVKVLEINAKSGMYPLLAAYNIYTRKLKSQHKSEDKIYGKLWSEVLSDHIFVLCKSPMAQTITTRTLAGYSGAKVNIVHINKLITKLSDEKGYNLSTQLESEFGEKVKFTAVVGNPPYQINTGTNFAKPIYHLFIEAAKSLNPDYVSLIHPARFLFNAGATPKEWNQKMLNDPHLSIPLYAADSRKIFPSVDIKGGIAISLWNKHQTNGGLGGVFIAHKEMRNVIKKVGYGGFDTIVGSRGGTRAKTWLDSYERPRAYFPSSVFVTNPELFAEKADTSHKIKLVGLIDNKRIERYVNENLLDDQNIAKWKLFLPKSIGSGTFGEALSAPIFGEPLTGCTESFIQIGPFDSETEAKNCEKYFKTKFCRALLNTLKVTQDNSRSTWKNVPLKDFSPQSQIDWSDTVSSIDQQLYKEYSLDEEAIHFIETNVKAME
ncbi:MAG TPA: Eco57I restriction-modification methylase domain-containing protein [Candidatus Saccharimonadia bacterium]|nr:Eco57I restriction-modification methylase domain-containing protein [Candidatus Saccharimonadia bacterium]